MTTLKTASLNVDTGEVKPRTKFGPSLAWTGCCALAMKDGHGTIADMPDGLYVRSFGPWRIILNGRQVANQHDGREIDPYGVIVEFNGWPAGVLAPGGGALIVNANANEAALITAIEAELGTDIETYLATRPN